MAPTQHTLDIDTEESLDRLKAGIATQEDRDRVLHFMARTRWTSRDLKDFVASTHSELCNACPNKRKPIDATSLIRTLLWVIAVLGSVLAAIFKITLPTL